VPLGKRQDYTIVEVFVTRTQGGYLPYSPRVCYSLSGTQYDKNIIESNIVHGGVNCDFYTFVSSLPFFSAGLIEKDITNISGAIVIMPVPPPHSH